MTPRTVGTSAARRLTSARAENRGGEPAIPPVPRTPLVAAGDFGARLPAGAVAAAIAAGLRAGGWPDADVCLLADDGVARELEALGFDVRLRQARALVLAQRRLAESTLQASAAFELATRARQTGVPCYAVTARNGLDAFDARMLDLQLVIEARDLAALQAAGRRLARQL
jgi:glycerate 2-kinase